MIVGIPHLMAKSTASSRRPILAAALVLLALLNGRAAAAAETVTLQLKWLHQFQFAGYYAAQEKGFYAEAGFDVKIVERDPKIRTIDAVLDGTADYGVADSSVILYRLRKRPVVVLGVVFQHSPLVLLTRPEDQLFGPYELKGKRVMYQKGQDDAVLAAMFHQLGIKDSDIVHVPHNFDDKALLNGSVDAMSAYITDQPFYYKSLGLEVHTINPLNYGIDFYGDLLFAHEKTVRADPEKARRFLEASLRGWRYALKNKEEVIGWLKTKYHSDKSVDHLRFEADQTEKMILPNVVEIGYTNVNRFQRISDVYRKEGMAPKDANFDGVYLGEYLEETATIPYWVNFLFLGILFVSIGALCLFALNRKLNNLVSARTQELETAHYAAQSASLAKSEFLSVVNHELRTPLTSIKGSLKLLCSGALENAPDKKSNLLKIADRNVARLGELVDDILDVNQIESGQMKYQFAPLELTGLVRESVETNKGFAEQHGVRFVLGDFVSGARVEGDAVRLAQVIANLLSNAAKFSPPGSEVTIATTNGGGYARVSVTDKGPGIPDSFRSRIFDRFTRVDNSDDRQIGGTGLGLNISKSIVETHGGEIGFETELGVGSTFFFTLPNKA